MQFNLSPVISTHTNEMPERSAGVRACGLRQRPAASSRSSNDTGRDAPETRRRDAGATMMSMQAYLQPLPSAKLPSFLLTCRVIGVALAKPPSGRRGHEIRTSARQNGTGLQVHATMPRRRRYGSAAVPGCGCGRRLAASSNTGRDARPTRRRDACATRFTQDHAAPTALGSSAGVRACGLRQRPAASSRSGSDTGRDAPETRRRDGDATSFIELKIPIKFSTRFGNGRILPSNCRRQREESLIEI